MGGLVMIWLFVIIAVICSIGIIYSANKPDYSLLAILSYGGLSLSVGVILTLTTTIDKSKEYPKSEYTLEYKVTTIGEQSDTTYVLTKIKED